MRPLRVGVIGCARMGSWFDDKLAEIGRLDLRPSDQAHVLAEIPGAQLAAGCDLDPQKLEAFRDRWGVEALYTDYKEMLAKEELDIVSIVTAWGSIHGELAAGVAESGRVKGIYCEKPIGASMQQADRIVAAVEKNNIAFTCAYLRRWHMGYRSVRRLIADGAIGKVRSIFASGVGTLMHAGTHYLDIMAYLAGDPQPAWLVGAVEGEGQDPSGTGVLAMEGGVRFLFEGVSSGAISFQITGTDGRLWMVNDGRTAHLWRKDPEGSSWLVPNDVELEDQGKSTTLRAMEELVEAVRRGDTQTSCDVRTAARAMEMALAVHISQVNQNARVVFPIGDRTLAVDTK